MKICYALFFKTLNSLLYLAKYFIQSGKIADFINGRIYQKWEIIPPKNGVRYWFHCASLGEFEQARPIIELLKKADSSCSIVITFFSPSGFNLRKNYDLADAVLYLPLDTPKNAQLTVQNIKPDAVVFVKYELWYLMIKEVLNQNIPFYLVSAVFRNNHLVFKPWGKFIHQLLPNMSAIFLQDKNSFQLLNQLHLKQIYWSGDTRFDRVLQFQNNSPVNSSVFERFKNQIPTLILGSSWKEEEEIALKFLQNNPNFKLIIAPHDISKDRIFEIKKLFHQFNGVLYTEISDLEAIESKQILILDTMGQLSSAYQYSDFALVGGGFGKGLHNILEPLAHDIPVVFGHTFNKHPEAKMAIDEGIAFSISDEKDLELIKNQLLNIKDGQCYQFIKRNSGASQMVFDKIFIKN